MSHICGVSKTFGEWYQKTNKTEDTNKLTLLAFKIIAILHSTPLATFIKLLKTVSKGLFRNRSQNCCPTFLDCRRTAAIQCFPNFSTSRYPWHRSSYLTVPLMENTYFFKLIYFLIISYVRDKLVYCCWVSIYALINDVILFIYLAKMSTGMATIREKETRQTQTYLGGAD
jgi:hypothetical protein